MILEHGADPTSGGTLKFHHIGLDGTVEARPDLYHACGDPLRHFYPDGFLYEAVRQAA